MRRLIIILVFGIFMMAILYDCNTETKNPFRNIHNEQATYVGMEKCKSCHWQVYETFIKTGMGQSWGIANKQKSAADFSPAKALVYDSIKNYYYKPFWDGDSLCILEFRLAGKDTIHKRLEKVSYIVGSGQHTNSHIININGYLHQAPITFYTQKGKWDLAPGFEKGMNTRFDRKIELECISCHNGYPSFDEASLNKYTQVKLGIDCERCHGPGSIHVSEKRNGTIIDTSKGPDFSIVNPRRLTIDQQNSLCQRCHLQGIAVLNDDKSFFDFMPSDNLHKTMNVFMPNYGNDEKHMIMASHVERLAMSQCFLKSKNISCITCHNPHVSVKYTPQQQYNTACKNCHQGGKDCKETLSDRVLKKDACVDCHMPKNSSIDIPHVAVTDHFIRRRPEIQNKNEIIRFLGMKCYNNEQADARSMARAYMEFFERYEPKPVFLDSAFHYLQKAGVPLNSDDPDNIRAYFLQENFSMICKVCKSTQANECLNAWTAYRIGASFLNQSQLPKAIEFLKQSVKIKPQGLDFQYKLACAYLDMKDEASAKNILLFILSENPKYTKAHSQLGFILMNQHDIRQAIIHFQEALRLDPDQIQTLINLAVCYHQENKSAFILPILRQAERLDPQNLQVKAMINDLSKP